LERSRRPKILVAGLSKCVECFVDLRGEYVGAVSTFSIYDPQDDVGQLQALAAELLTPAVTERFRTELGSSAMGGGSITMKKGFLADLPTQSASA
jgi:hypothetical protein